MQHNPNRSIIAVLCETRCGHTSMKEYLHTTINSPPLGKSYIMDGITYESINDIEADRIVLVVRQPYDRLWSSRTHTDNAIKAGKVKSRLRDKWISDHSSLYLHKLCKSGKITHIIPFQNLLEYIPVSSNTMQYHITPNHTRFEDWMYNYHSQDDMELEYSAYCVLMDTIPQVSVEDWNKYILC